MTATFLTILSVVGPMITAYLGARAHSARLRRLERRHAESRERIEILETVSEERDAREKRPSLLALVRFQRRAPAAAARK
jgi:hypothetical protein